MVLYYHEKDQVFGMEYVAVTRAMGGLKYRTGD
jgi:hypothetical protein